MPNLSFIGIVPLELKSILAQDRCGTSFKNGSSHEVKVMTGVTVRCAYQVITLSYQHHVSVHRAQPLIQSAIIGKPAVVFSRWPV